MRVGHYPSDTFVFACVGHANLGFMKFRVTSTSKTNTNVGLWYYVNTGNSIYCHAIITTTDPNLFYVIGQGTGGSVVKTTVDLTNQ